ncbi:NAD(P)/FAD-dependent oxidoreductase [Rhizobium sp. RAF56]|uniref:NAD(P)/FAD-dependent oxidoreductase n=1 Tax=Rhizobium sp. RAF56 TaxID=3233062 RepID=UPI003F953211
MANTQHVIVVGAGIIGASIAWHLVRRGASVTIVAARAGGEATPNSFAWINASWGNPEPYFRFRIHSMKEWRRLAEAVDGIPLKWCGGLCWDLPPKELEAYATEHAGWGYGIRKVDRDKAARLEPGLSELPESALHVAEEGAAEPVATTHLLLADAVRRGVRFHPNVNALKLARDGERVVGVNTADGMLQADRVVLAAGFGTVALAASAGINLPVEAPPGLIVHSGRYRPVLKGLVLAPELHMRQTSEGRIIAGSDFGGGDPGAEPRKAAARLFAKVKAMLKDADDLELDFHTVGYRPTPKDGFPIIGGVDGAEGVYVAVLHSGITLAPLVGRLAADEILGMEQPLLSPFRLSRFGA